MRKLSLLAILILYTGLLSAQKIQWAAEVVDYSSQLSTDAFSAQQVLGVPNAMSSQAVKEMAWAPAKDDNYMGEYVQVKFAKPIRIQQIVVAESFNPGSIERITLYDTRNRRHLIYENDFPEAILERSRMFKHTFPETNYEVAQLLVELKTSAVKGANQIDAIGISNELEEVKVQPVLSKGSGLLPNAEDLGFEINSKFAERLPIISPDGNTLFFARKYHPQNFGEEDFDDIWFSKRNSDGTWNKPQNIGAPLNNKDHNFVVATNPAGNVLYLANDYRSNRKDGVSVSRKIGRSWSTPKALDIEDHYNDNPFVSYHVSVDQKVLLMSVERREGFGDRDLYVSFNRGNNKWSKPRNLGSTINTVGMESSVFLAADGKTIYFASNGHAGYGGLDMYRSQRLDKHWTKWTKPQNMGPQINTPANDYNFTIPASGEYAYFSTDNASGMSDLYRILLPEELRPEPVTLVTGKIIDQSSKQPVDATITYQSLNSKDQASRTVNTPGEESFKFIVPHGESVGVYAEKDGYFAVSENVDFRKEQMEELDYTPESYRKASISVKPPDNQEIEGLQLKINALDEEVKDLEIAKKENPREVRTITTGGATSFKDPELEALKAKFNNLNNKKASPKPKPEVKKQAQTNLTEKSPEKADELQAMKDKFNKAYGLSEAKKDEKIDSRAILKTRKSPQKDDDLVEMKRRYNQAMGREPVFEEEKIEEPASATDTFEDLEQAVRRELEKDLIDDVKIDLQKELLQDVKEELAPNLETTERNQLNNPEIDNTVQTECAEAVKIELRLLYAEEVKNELRAEWQDDIKEELRNKLRESVILELRRALREEVKEELKQELIYQIKKEIKEELRKELETKLKAQIEAEDDLPLLPSPSSEEDLYQKEEPSYQELEKEIVLIPIKVGQVIPMNNIFFDSNETTLKDASFTELQRVLEFLEQNSQLIVEVGGHTNGWCSHVFANELSDGRAKVVADYFMENGIPPSRIQYKGYGKTKPVASNDNAAGRKKNQRVELTILEIR